MRERRDKKSKEDLAQESLFREVEEDLRDEKIRSFWKQYGDYVIGGAVALVVAVGAFEGWKAWDASMRGEASASFVAAVASAAEDPTAAETRFRELAADAPDGYAFIAAVREAETLRAQGDAFGAAALYARLASETEDPLHRGFVELVAVMSEMEAGTMSEPDALRARLEPLAVDGQPWRHTARELMAHLALQSGDRKSAEVLFGELADDISAPQRLRQRARAMAAEARGG